MKSKLLSVLSVATLALAIASPASFAKVYSPAQFTAELKKKVGKKKGSAAVSAAAGLYKSALSDKKNKKNVLKYSSSVVSVLKKAITTKDQAKAVDKLVTNLLNGYFKGLKFNISDKGYNNSLAKLATLLSASNRTTAVSQSVYNSIKSFAARNGTSQTAAYDYFLGVNGKLKLPPPPIS